ncbi:MAG: type VI secretion system tip protein TssI/VgrG [Polyangiaceae bacterium]
MDEPIPSGDLFELRAGPGGDLTLEVAAFRGREGMSRLYRFDVTFLSELEPQALRRAVLGRPVELSLQSPGLGLSRSIRGIAASLVELGTRDDRGRAHFTLRLVPRAWLLRKRRASRIFQDMTVEEVVRSVLTEHRVKHAFRISRAYPKRAYCVQYQETDHDFVTRLLAEDGLFYCFEEHGRAGGAEDAPWDQREEVLIAGDTTDAYTPLPTGDLAGASAPLPVVPFRAMAGGLGDEHVSSLRRISTVRPEVAVHHDYDFERPMLDLTASTLASASASAEAMAAADERELPDSPALMEDYDHHGDHSNVDDALDRADIRLEQLRREALVTRGESDCRRLAPGRTFRLEGCPEPHLDADLVITRVSHEGRVPGRAAPAAAGERPYRARFDAVRAHAAFRPAPPARKLVHAVESAVVVGPEKEVIYTDEYGRIKVQFHWDREGKRDDRSSCWVRLSQPWAGAGWGLQLIPRVGNEVLVSFLGGDPDRPVVVGSLHNRIHMPPFPLPFAKTRSGIRTSSTGGGGGNELSFEDAAGQEQVRLYARRDLEEEVQRHHTHTVHGSQTAAVHGDRSITVSGTQKTTVLRDDAAFVHGSRSAAVTGDDVTLVTGNTRADRRGDVDLDLAGDVRSVLGGAATARIEGPAQLDAAGDLVTNVEGDHRLTVGVDGTENTSTTYVFGAMRLSATDRIELRADQEISLTCGSTTLRLTPENLTALGKALHLVAAEEMISAGGKAVQTLKDDAELIAETASLFSKGASLELTDSQARLGGRR